MASSPPITDAQSHVTTYGYDAHGNRTSVADAMQHQTTFGYDTGDRLTTITYPDQTTTTFGYDTRGRRTSVTDQNGKQTTYAYDDADRLLSVTDAAHHVTQYAYDEKATSLASPFPTTTRPEPASPIGYLRRSAATLASANRDLTSYFVAGGPAHAPGIEAYED